VHYNWCPEGKLPEPWAIPDKQKKKSYLVQHEGQQTAAVRLSESEEYNPKGACFMRKEVLCIFYQLRLAWHSPKQTWILKATATTGETHMAETTTAFDSTLSARIA
jgi:hypothetical protein